MLIANLLNIQFYYLRKLKDSRIGKCIALPFTVTDFDSVFFSSAILFSSTGCLYGNPKTVRSFIIVPNPQFPS